MALTDNYQDSRPSELAFSKSYKLLIGTPPIFLSPFNIRKSIFYPKKLPILLNRHLSLHDFPAFFREKADIQLSVVNRFFVVCSCRHSGWHKDTNVRQAVKTAKLELRFMEAYSVVCRS